MYGLDQTLVDHLDFGRSLNRIKTDVLTDFILAPHYSAVYEHASDELVQLVKNVLKSGEYSPEPTIKVDVPKPSGLTRPGAILSPIDRLIYQVIVDAVANTAESQLDRARVFSHVLLADDPKHFMFKPSDESWREMEAARNGLCQDDRLPYAVQTDVACYFERLYQHNLVNLLRSTGCDSRCVNLLEKMLSAFSEKDSHGIPQGMFPSDFLGNFYLTSVDNFLTIHDIQSVRYLDDIYLFFTSLRKAQQGLVELCRILRDEGLNLNESKTRIVQSRRLLAEETELDRRFAKAKEELRKTPVLVEEVQTSYGFQSIWRTGEEVFAPGEIELKAVRSLYKTPSISAPESEKVIRFCLPYFSKANDGIAVDDALNGITSRPYMSKVFCSYLKPFAHKIPAVSKAIEAIVVRDALPYDWSLVWPIAVLIGSSTVESECISKTMRVLEDSRRADALRAVCALLVARHGTPPQRRLLRHWYDREPSPYVKAAILYSARHFPTDERNSCLAAWGGHSATNSLIAKAIR